MLYTGVSSTLIDTIDQTVMTKPVSRSSFSLLLAISPHDKKGHHILLWMIPIFFLDISRRLVAIWAEVLSNRSTQMCIPNPSLFDCMFEIS